MDFGQLRERTLWAAFLSIMKLVEEPADGERMGEVLGLVEEALAGSNTELFGRLLEYLFRNARSVDRPRILKQFKNMKTEEHQVQGKTIAEHLIEEGMEKGLERGRERGRQEGMQEGMQAGQRAMLLRQIRRRFGDLPAWAEETVERAYGSELEAMMDRLLEARSLAEVLGERER
jgi:flagellar biosynthesis/type III secretory pathway protein FliH